MFLFAHKLLNIYDLNMHNFNKLAGTQEGAEEMLEQGVEALRAEEPIAAAAGGRAGESRIGDSPD